MILRAPVLRDALRRLPGRKIVFSNSPRAYAELVLRRLGRRPFIDADYTIEDTGYRGKPDLKSFRSTSVVCLLRSMRKELVAAATNDSRSKEARLLQ